MQSIEKFERWVDTEQENGLIASRHTSSYRQPAGTAQGHPGTHLPMYTGRSQKRKPRTVTSGPVSHPVADAEMLSPSAECLGTPRSRQHTRQHTMQLWGPGVLPRICCVTEASAERRQQAPVWYLPITLPARIFANSGCRSCSSSSREAVRSPAYHVKVTYHDHHASSATGLSGSCAASWTSRAARQFFDTFLPSICPKTPHFWSRLD